LKKVKTLIFLKKKTPPPAEKVSKTFAAAAENKIELRRRRDHTAPIFAAAGQNQQVRTLPPIFFDRRTPLLVILPQFLTFLIY